MNDKYYIYYYGQDGAVEKHIEDTWDGLFDHEMLHFSKEQVFVHKTTNPYIWCEKGITPDDINNYEFENAVKPTMETAYKKLIKSASDGLKNIIEPRKGWKREYLAELEPKQCTCDSMDLFRYGCKCGGV
jgi:hypothetical protein